MRAFLLLPLLAITGCASWPTETRVEESAYQLSHALDTAQTVEIGRSDGRYHETESNMILGREPKPLPTVAYMGVISGVHAGITACLIDHDAPTWAVRSWEALSIGWSVDHVAHNASIGIRF